MITCEKLGVLVVVALGLLQHVGAADRWMGMPVQGGSGLSERQLIDCGEGMTACGTQGCVPTGRCCNPDGNDGAWSCGEGEACYTVSTTVDCYASTWTGAVAPTTARECYDYTASGCSGWIGCFQCLDTAAPFCATKSVAGSRDIWIICNAVGGSDPVPGSATTTRIATSNGFSSTAAATRPTASSASGPTSTLAPFTGPDTTGGSGGTTVPNGVVAGVAIAGFVAVSAIGVLAFLLYSKGKKAQPLQSHPQPLMNDIDRHSDMMKHEPVVELSGETVHPQMELQELDCYVIKDHTPPFGPSELA